MSNNQPSEPPPAYEPEAQSGSMQQPMQQQPMHQQQQQQPMQQKQQQLQQQQASGQKSGGQNMQSGRHEARPGDRDISKEDRPLPPGWLPQYDSIHDRFFFVDTRNPGSPRSIWTHPIDDPDWLRTVPRGMSPEQYIDRLWQEQPDPDTNHGSASQGRGQQGQQGQQVQKTNFPGIPPVLQGHTDSGGQDHYGQGQDRPPYQQGQGSYQSQGQDQGQGQQRSVTMKELVQRELETMGTPEEYARKNPPGKASGLFHHKETPEARQRRHAIHRAENKADQMAYASPAYSPYGGGYGYPGYGRGMGALYPMGMGYGGFGPMGMGMGGLGMGMGGMGMMGGGLGFGGMMI